MTNNNQQVILSDRQQKLRNYHARKIAEKNKKNKTAVDQQQQPTVAATDQENYNGGTSKSNDNIPFINHRGNIKPTNISSSGSSKLSIGKSSSSSKSVGSADIKKMSSTQKAIFMAKRTKKKMSPTSSSASNTTNINSTTNKSKSMTHADTSNNSKQQQEPPSKPHRAIHPFSGTHTKNQLSFNINDRIYLDFNNLSSNGWVWGYMIKASAESSEEGREVREEGKVGGMGAEGRGEVREEDREYGWCPLSYLVEVQPSDIGRDVDKSNIDKKEEIKEKEVKKVRREEEVKSSANTVKTKKPLSTADSKETTTAKMETTSSSSSTTTSRTTTSTTNTNKSTKDDKMKQLFAARRRKAQIEMKNMPLILNSSTVSAGASTIGGESVTSSYSGGEGTNSIDNDTISLCGSVKTLGSSVMDSADGSSKDGSTSDGNSTAKSVGSAKPPKSTYSSRRALDRYLGKKSSSSRGIKNNKSVGGSSVGSSTSTKDTKSTLDGDNDDEEDEDISTLGSTSMDSLDNNHTALSSSSRGGGGAGSGTILSPVREETFFHNSGSGVSSSDLARSSSVSTVLIDNTSSAAGGIVKADTVASSIDEENGTKVMENDSSITGQQHLGESMNDSSNNGILHDRAYSKEDANTNDEHNEEQPPEKSVRFHLSPLEKMQREKEREKAQCSPPRVGSLTLENDDGNTKDSEEVVQQLEVCDDAENDSSHVVESNTRAAHDMVEEDVEFTKFMAALRKEVAGDHKELWSGFQSILGRSPSEQVPL